MPRRALAVGIVLCAMMVAWSWPVPRARAQTAPRPQPAARKPPRAIGYAMWNDELLVLGAKVDDINLTGASTTAMSEAWRDDAVDFCLDMSGAGGDIVHPGCARVVASAAGGFTVLAGTAAGAWRAQPDWLMGLKLGVEREGTRNRSDDTDTGYAVEVGIPWKFLGGPPKRGRAIGFNFVVHVRGENETLVSWSSGVSSPADLDRPARWGRMILSASSKPSVAENDVIICPFTYHPPLVDGRLAAGEWLTASVMQLEKPAPELVRQPAAGKPAGAPAAGGRLLATYRYDYYQVAHAANGGPGTARPTDLAHQPPDGVGPWFSADSVAWHASMLRQAREAAIDTVLPTYSGDPQARRTWSRLGLLRLAQALKETADNRLSYPLVGMYLDTSCLGSAGAADLIGLAGRQALWGMVREFFDIVPQEFRAQFDVATGDAANLLVLGPPPAGETWDRGFVDYCREMYRRAFGARLLVIGDEGWRANAPNLDGYCSLRPGVGVSYGKDGPRPVVRLSPGHVGPRILAREGGSSYEQNWTSTIGVLPDFVIVDSLNDFASGSEVANSRQYGVRFLDITRQSAQALAGRPQYHIAVLRATLPPALNPGATYQVELLVENRGFENLTESQNVEITYTLRNRQRSDVGRSGVATPRLFVRAGQRAPILVEVSTATVDGPLPVGDYELTFEVTKSTIPFLRSRWFARQLFEISLPVRLDRVRPWQATVLSTSLPSAMGTGSRRRVRVRLRNDGSSVWRAKGCALSYHWVRAPGPSAPGAQAETAELEGVRTPLPKDVKPGEMVTMYAWVGAHKADGAPLPAWSPDDDWLYQLQWDAVEGADRWFSRTGGDTAAEAVAVLPTDLGFTVVNADLPARLDAGKPYAVKVLVRNDGASAWDVQRCRVACRWYNWDGTEAQWLGSVTPLSAAGAPAAAVPPGEAALVTAEIRAPDCAGSYRVVWALLDDDRYPWQILDAGSRSVLAQPVSVTGGIYEPLDVSPYVNVLASTFAGHASRGAFDPAGSSLPAEFVPPDTGGPKVEDYPGIYYGAGDPGSAARVPLRYPAKDQRGAPAIACVGQRMALPQVPLRAIYLAASSSAAVEALFQVAYADGASEGATLRVPGWMDAVFDAPAALTAPYVRTTAGDVPGAARVYLLRIGDLARRDSPAALILPTAPQINIFAITVERQPVETSGGP